jgi:hypothetical protein
MPHAGAPGTVPDLGDDLVIGDSRAAHPFRQSVQPGLEPLPPGRNRHMAATRASTQLNDHKYHCGHSPPCKR